MAHWLLRNEGLFVGSSSALNVCAAVRTALELKKKTGSSANNANQNVKSASIAVPSGEGERLRVV
eukprot:CAMPEP_0184991672 /NCGR_PEP_ID=MMETSP1098-20130426/37665_1 /TAXON_ID=89044 /ORGANISM="Spumella elongata, Strain CCAP 955/1" /LENGTH=64 /DNA_ID=CAMNT_0027517135 /DNA_START=15 /DNA_END=206 /DNA_ORIENTATION=-